MTPIFITGIGTGVGKTVTAAIVTEALQADYWKPIQSGNGEGTDSEWVQTRLSNPLSRIHPEAYSLALPASPHIAAREEGITIEVQTIVDRYRNLHAVSQSSGHLSTTPTPDFLSRPIVIEGAGGLLVPLNDHSFMLDLIKALQAKTILVSHNYLGSINHSLLTAEHCKKAGIDVLGWIFNGSYLNYEQEIADWTGLPILGSLPWTERPDKEFIKKQADKIRPRLEKALHPITA